MDFDELSAAGERPRPLRRLREGRVLSGTAAGLACYLDADVTAIRLAFVALTLLGGVGVPAYLACWLLIPDEGTGAALAEGLLGQVGEAVTDLEDRLRWGRSR